MYMSEKLKPFLLGVGAGAAVLAFVGFVWGGWTTASSASAMAKDRAERAVVLAYANICVDAFKQQADYAAKVEELRALGFSAQSTFVADGGWATMPGTTAPATGVGAACAKDLLSSS
jgi:hypothetical protein